jgi:hypothetical protein
MQQKIQMDILIFSEYSRVTNYIYKMLFMASKKNGAKYITTCWFLYFIGGRKLSIKPLRITQNPEKYLALLFNPVFI